MKSAFRATAVLSSSSAVSILISLAATKVLALVLQPEGYGYYGLLQSLVAVGSLVAGMGIATGVVRLGAGPATREDGEELANLRAAAWVLTGIMSAAAMAALVILRIPLSRWALGSSEHHNDLVLVGLALCCTIGLNVQNGMLNAWHKVHALALFGVVNTACSCAISIAAVGIWHTHGIVAAVVGGAFAGWLTSFYFLRRYVPRSEARASRSGALRSMRSLLTFGVPFTASATLGTGIQLALPMLVVHLFDTAAVAYYKAAAAISVSYLGFLVTAMGQDYYPRLSAVRGQPEAMMKLIDEQHRLILLLAAPIVLGTLALVPYLVPLVYSSRFEPAIQILEWQLIGDLFKFSAWTVSFAILAQSSPAMYLLAESIGGISMVLCTWGSVSLFGLRGLGIGFLVAYALYYVAVRRILGRELPLRVQRGNTALMAAAITAALLIRLLPATPLAAIRTPLALLLALGYALYSARTLRHEYLGGRRRREATVESGEPGTPAPHGGEPARSADPREAVAQAARPSWTLVVASNDEQVLSETLLASPAIDDQCQVVVERGAASAGDAYNRGLKNALADLVVFAHQDVYLPAEWLARLHQAIDGLDRRSIEWGVLGVFGAAADGAPELRGHCYSTGLARMLGEPFSSPIPARTLDEMVLVLRRSSGLTFDENLPGFHLYGADICLRAEAAGLTNYIVPAFCIHNSNGIERLPRAFWTAYFYLRKKWRKELPVTTCCTRITRLGLPVLRRWSAEWWDRLLGQPHGRRTEKVATLCEQLMQDSDRPSAAKSAEARKIAILGATMETPNLGVSVLATGAVAVIRRAFPRSEIVFLDYAQSPTSRTVRAGSRALTIPLVNMRFSKRFWLANNIAVLLALACLLRLSPRPELRDRILRKNRCLDEICSADLFASVAGGDSFSDLYGCARFLYVALPQLLILLLGKKLILLPQTYGPFRHGWTRVLARWIVSRAEAAWSRDHESLSLLMQAPSRRPGPQWGFCYDLGFGIDAQPPERIEVEGIAMDPHLPAGLTGLNISGLLFRDSGKAAGNFGLRTDYRELVIDLAESFLAAGRTVLLIPHVYGDSGDRESDVAACAAVFAHLQPRYEGRIGILRGKYGPEEIRHIIGSCEFFIGSRMHACIAAIAQGRPAVSIAYSNKFAAVMRTLGMDALVADARVRSHGTIVDMAHRAYKNRARLALELQNQLPAVRRSVLHLLLPLAAQPSTEPARVACVDAAP